MVIEEDKSKSVDKYDEQWFLFRRNVVLIWISMAIISYSIIPFVTSPEFDAMNSPDVVDLLYANAGILATILTITLGITLLGLQFRSQSYTMVGLSEYIKDKVIYGFISVFIAGIVFNMIATWDLSLLGTQGQIHVWFGTWLNIQPDHLFLGHERIMLYSMLTTFFALCYNAGYVYHVIYKLQFSQMLNDVKKKMEKSIIYDKNNENKDASGKESFVIWEGIMKKVITTGEAQTFKDGLNGMLEIITKHPDNKEKSEECITKVMDYSTTNNDHMASVEFMVVLKEDRFSKQLEKKYVIDILKLIMKKAGNHDDATVFEIGIQNLLKIAARDSEKMEDIAYFITNLMNYCIMQNRRNVLHKFMFMLKEKEILMENNSDKNIGSHWRITLWGIFGHILHKSMESSDTTAFPVFMIMKMEAMNKILCDDYEESEKNRIVEVDSNMMSDIMEYAIANDYHAIIRCFVEAIRYIVEEGYFGRWFMSDKSTNKKYADQINAILMKCTFKAINVNDKGMFNAAITPIIFKNIWMDCHEKHQTQNSSTHTDIRKKIIDYCKEKHSEYFINIFDNRTKEIRKIYERGYSAGIMKKLLDPYTFYKYNQGKCNDDSIKYR